MNYGEIIDILREEGTAYELGYNEIGYNTGRTVNGSYARFVKGVGEYIEVDKYGGEGQGDTWYSIKYFPDHDIYIKVEGYYSSYEGTSIEGWHCCTEVRPQEKTIIVYNEV